MPVVDTDNLQSIKKYADNYMSRRGIKGVSVTYVYQLIKRNKVQAVQIDGVMFIVLPPSLAAAAKAAGELG